jgi:hypothetical protein
MGEVVDFEPAGRVAEKIAEKVDKRQLERDDYVRGQQIIADAIFHWKNDKSTDARAAVRFLMRHLATAFRADDTPLQPRPVAE